MPLLALVPAVFVLTSCTTNKTHKAFPVVNAARIRSATFRPSVQSISVLESTSNVSLKPESDGRVVKIVAQEGQRVKAGDTILVLDNVQQSAALDSARAEARTDQLNAERYAFLYSQGAASAQQRDQYLTQAIASRDKARADAATLGYKFVRAPIDGIVGDLDTVKIGDYVQTGQAITGIVNNSTLWTLMKIPAATASSVKIGQTVTVKSQTNPPVSGSGQVSFISPYFGIPGNTSAPNTVLVKATFPNLTGKLKTGQYVKSTIITGEQTSLAVPVQSVFMQAQQPFVYVVVPLTQALPKIKASSTVPQKTKESLEKLPGSTSIVVQKAIKLGPLQNNLYPIQSGLKSGELVVTSNTALLRNGMPVQIKTGGN